MPQALHTTYHCVCSEGRPIGFVSYSAAVAPFLKVLPHTRRAWFCRELVEHRSCWHHLLTSSSAVFCVLRCGGSSRVEGRHVFKGATSSPASRPNPIALLSCHDQLQKFGSGQRVLQLWCALNTSYYIFSTKFGWVTSTRRPFPRQWGTWFRGTIPGPPCRCHCRGS